MGKLRQLMTKKNWNKVKRLIKQGQWKPLVRGALRKMRLPEQKVQPAYAYEHIVKSCLRRRNETASSMLGVSVDIIVPVYNGKEYLVRLLEGVEKTSLSYRLLLIDDASPDPETEEFLKEYASSRKNVELIRNARNMGFVGSVNRGLAMSRNHVVLLNTDVELPENWLERLIAPIVKDPTVASATPFTNSGTICSFPEFLKDNQLFNELSVDRIDGYFKEIRSIYTTIPTGVGFCMAMSQAAIRDVGLLDQKTFGKGYGEENDWCQMAIAKGYRNVMVENLYVYHNHGGTFCAEEKRRLIAMNQEKLAIKHPNYANLVGEYTERDPMGKIRAFVFARLTAGLTNRRYMIFHNELGGGADAYAKSYAAARRAEGAVTALVRYQRTNGHYQIEYQWQGLRELFDMQSLDEVFQFAHQMNLNRVVVNQLVTYSHIEEHLTRIREYVEERGIRLMVMVHDYYLICPSIYLLNNRYEYCHIPTVPDCEKCISQNAYRDNFETQTMRDWRNAWRTFLQAAQEIRVFSQDSANLVKRAYGGLEQIQVLPEQHTALTKVEKPYKTTQTLNIGLLGTLTELKGAQLIQDMVELAEERKLPVRFILCGKTTERIQGRYFEQTGPYRPEMLPRLVLEKDIDIFFISSICPETFSYTTQEALEMDMPVACLPIGAPVERILRSKKGTVLSEANAQQNLKELMEFGEQYTKEKKQARYEDKVLFVIEEESYASRYRAEHLREQLFAQGIQSDCFEVSEMKASWIRKYKWMVLYRCEMSRKVKRLIAEANSRGMSVWYGVDDLVFDYAALRGLPFLRQPEYRRFESQCGRILACMNLCDGILVSTNTLKEEVQKRFPEKPVVVQRNVASYEMAALSQKAYESAIVSANAAKKEKTDGLVLGYFSGSSTHDEDFAGIQNVLLDILKNNPKVSLRIGGVLELSKEFDAVGDRIQRLPFRPWQELPELLAGVDINLMPLQKSVFHACKSENKWLEASLVHVPTVASYNEELASVIHTGQDGFLCQSTEDWRKNLNMLLEDASLRRSIGDAAYDCVISQHTTRQMEPEVRAIFE